MKNKNKKENNVKIFLGFLKKSIYFKKMFEFFPYLKSLLLMWSQVLG
jgi:hypothetical protein